MNRLYYSVFFILLLFYYPVSASDFKQEVEVIRGQFEQGNYKNVRDRLLTIERDYFQDKNVKQVEKGLVFYWRALTYNRLQDYSNAVSDFSQSINLKYTPQDIYYEYGQALYASEKLKEARAAFKQSLSLQYKKAVSLYYIAYITQLLGENKKAISLYKALDKLPKEERDQVWQPSLFQIGDIYLEEAEKQPDAFRAVENYVIPQYKEAIKVNPKSPLAIQIEKKIKELQQKYELVVFQLRNGRPTLIPPYYLRLAQDITYDTNPIFAPTESSFSEADTSSLVSRTDVMGRYTFYYKNMLSIAPEIRTNYTYHLKRESQVYRNDNYLIAPAIRTAYEHRLWKKPASHLFDVDYSYAHRDVNAEKKLVFSSRSYSFMLGERFNYFSAGESIIRLRKRYLKTFISASNMETTGISFEQVASLNSGYLVLMNVNYDMNRVESDILDSNELTTRVDLILPRYKEWFTPSFGLSLTRINPINNKDDRGIEWRYNPSFKIAKTIGKNYRVNFHYDYMRNNSKEKESFDFKRHFYGLELEYLF